MRKTSTGVFAAVLASSLMLTACGGGGGLTKNASFSKMAAYDGAAYPVNGMAVAETAASMDMASGIMADTGYGGMEEDLDPGYTADPGADEARAGRKLIRNVSISMETTDFETAVQEVSRNAEFFGGYIESSGISGSSMEYEGTNYADIVARIPQARLDEFLETAGSLGNVTYRNENTDDITLRYADTEDHIKTLEIEQDRLWELMERADTIETVIALEERLSEIRYGLGSYQTQLKVYDNQVDYSTVSISIREVRLYSQMPKDSMLTRIAKGFKGNVQFLRTFAEDAIVWVASHIVTLLIFGGVSYLIGWRLGKWARKRKDKKKSQGAQPAQEENGEGEA